MKVYHHIISNIYKKIHHIKLEYVHDELFKNNKKLLYFYYNYRYNADDNLITELEKYIHVECININDREKKIYNIINEYEIDEIPTIYLLPHGIDNINERMKYVGYNCLDNILEFIQNH